MRSLHNRSRPRSRFSLPEAGRSLHVIGDTHFGQRNGVNFFARDNPGIVLADLPNLPVVPFAHLCTGDNIGSDGTTISTDDDATAKAWLDSLTAVTGAPWYTQIGNVDIEKNLRTYADWEAIWGPRNQSIDFDFCRLVICSPDDVALIDGNYSQIRLTQTTLDWLDAELAASTVPTLVAFHAPLYNTVLGWRGSTDPTLFIVRVGDTDDLAVRAVVGAHDCVFAVITGHTHNQSFENVVKRELVGSRWIAAINGMALNYTGHDAPMLSGDVCRTSFVTIPASGDRVEVRIRDHVVKAWMCPADFGPVATIYPTAA